MSFKRIAVDTSKAVSTVHSIDERIERCCAATSPA